jgi:nicotinamidase-related amidase
MDIGICQTCGTNEVTIFGAAMELCTACAIQEAHDIRTRVQELEATVKVLVDMNSGLQKEIWDLTGAAAMQRKTIEKLNRQIEDALYGKKEGSPAGTEEP